MRTGRPKQLLVLTSEDRETLERWTRRPTTAQALAQRARVVLSCAGGHSNLDVAREQGVTRQMVGRWRQRFLAKGVNGLLDEPSEPRARFPMLMLNVSSVLRLRQNLTTPHIGALDLWRSDAGSARLL